MTTKTMPVRSAAELADSPAVAEAIETIVAELRRAQSSITKARPPDRALAGAYDAWLKRYAETKGRPPYYPYLGSGLGNGPLVQLADGSVKWDMISGVGVHMFGHGDPDLAATALRAALCDTVMQGNLQYDAGAIELADLLVAEAARASRMKHCFLINSGALANESALKVCFQHNAPADRVLAFQATFAGRTLAMLQVGDSAAAREGIPVTLPVDYVPFYDAERGEASTQEAVQRLDEHLERYPGRYSCFSMELIQGEGGFNIAPREFFIPLMERCRKHNIAVWLDEIQTFGRTGEMFCFERLDLGEYADVVTIGKLSQMCACLFTADYNPKPGLLSATFVGSSVAIQVGKRILERLREGAYFGPDGRIARLQDAFRSRAADLVERHPEWFPPIRSGGRRSTRSFDGVGGMMRLTPFGGRKTAVIGALRRLFDDGVLAFYCGHDPYHIRFLPPIGVMQPEQFDDVFGILESSLAKSADSA